MNYTDTQLKAALAKMLPKGISYLEVTSYESNKTVCLLQWGAKWNDERNFIVKNTELLHLCHLVEETLTPDEWTEYGNALSWYSLPIYYIHATWQQRVIALAKVKGIDI